ncbi:MAG: hypothetical protein ACLQUY_08120 [Ktedonobacterales bacterium]
MAAPKTERERSYVRAAMRLALLSLALLFLSLILLQITAGSVSASHHTATASQRQAVPMQTDIPTPTDTPADTPTDTPTATPTEIAPTATSTSVIEATSTAIPANTPADNGGGSASPGTTGPQPTKVVLTQPTVGNGSGSSLQGLSPSNFGTNGLLVATTLGCVVGLLGVVIGAFALRALVRSGYGPFLRALLRGDRKKDQKDQSGRSHGSSRTTRSGYNNSSDYAGGSPPSRQSRPGRSGEYSGDRYRR